MTTIATTLSYVAGFAGLCGILWLAARTAADASVNAEAAEALERANRRDRIDAYATALEEDERFFSEITNDARAVIDDDLVYDFGEPQPQVEPVPCQRNGCC